MTSHHVEHIKAYLKSQGFTDLELMDDLTDHLATEIEFSMDSEKLDFQASFEKAKQKLLPNSPYQLERDLKILTTPKHNIMMKKTAYIGGYLSALCLAIALLMSVITYKEKLNNDLNLEVAKIRDTYEIRTNLKANELNSEYYNLLEYSRLSLNQRVEAIQILIVVAIALFSISYLPYRFYNAYQRSQLEFNSI